MFLKKENHKEIILKYFLIQSFRSIILLLNIRLKMTYLYMRTNITLYINIMLIAALITKIGLAPLHLWIIEIRKKIKQINLFILLTVQKVAPIFIIIEITNTKILLLTSIISSVWGTIAQLTSLNLNILISYSSVSHNGWIIIRGIKSMTLFIIYISVYRIILIEVFKEIKKNTILYSIDFIKSPNFFIRIISLAGIPPFLGFYPKLIVLWRFLEEGRRKAIITLLILIRSLNCFIYLRIRSKYFLNEKIKIKYHRIKIRKLRIFINISPFIIILSFF